jgi:hypothetical protein
MSIWDRLYWLGRNLAAFILLILVSPFAFIYLFTRILFVLLITDGSEYIKFPWQYDWRWKI